jgi:hypothetical protein
MRLSSLVPPLLWNAARRMKTGVSVKRYPSFDAAAAKCGEGYDSDLIARAVLEKTERWLKTDGPLHNPATVRLVTALGLMRDRRTVNVLDFGGAAAGHYFSAKRVFGDSLPLRWCVVETRAGISNHPSCAFSAIATPRYPSCGFTVGSLWPTRAER